MRLLLVEDEVGIVNFLKKYLELENFIVDVAFEGISASNLARANEYNLILLDRMLPNKDGKTICKEIRESGKLTPILILSAINNFDEKIELLKLGANDYMEKPFALEELLVKIRLLIQQSK